MSTQYYAPEQHGPEQQDPRQQGQPTWQQTPAQPGWQQAPGQYAARRSTPWGAIIAFGAAVVVACTLAVVFLIGHSSTSTPSGSTPAPTSSSNQHGPVNPAVPTHPAVNPAVPTHPAVNPAVPTHPAG
jgi:hypothetical protein